MVDTLEGIKAGDVIHAPVAAFCVYKVDSKPQVTTLTKVRYMGRDDPYYTENVRHEGEVKVYGRFTCVKMWVKAVAADFTGHAKSKDTEGRSLVLFLNGDDDTFREYIKAHSLLKYYGIVNMKHATVIAGADVGPLVDVKRFKKMDLICAVIAVHGPSCKDDILRRVAALEGKPWVIGSNTDYFTKNKQGAIELCGKGERGRTLYHNTVEGWRRGSQVLGEFDAKIIEDLK